MTIIDPLSVESQDQREPLTCAHCGSTGDDVHYWRSWIGGRGYQSFAECDNQVECIERSLNQLGERRRIAAEDANREALYDL